MSASDLNRFIYVDTAVGGEGRRNNPMRLDQFNPPPGAVGVYTTYLAYDAGLVEWWKVTRNTKGGRTVGGYRGPCLATFLPFDIDREDPADALAATRRLVLWLVHHWAIPSDALRVVFSGRKGYHVEIPASLFGGFEPGVGMPDRLKRLAVALVRGCDPDPDSGLAFDLDVTAYEHLRLWRVPNSRHQKSKRYAIPLTADELLTLDGPAIYALSAAPRTVAAMPDDEWSARPELVALWQGTRSKVIAPTRRAAPLPERIKAGGGRRHAALLSLAGTLRRRGLGARVIGKMLAAFNEAVLDPPAPDEDVEGIAADIAGYAVDDVPSDRLLLSRARRAARKARADAARTYRVVDLGDVRRPEAALLVLVGGGPR